MVILDHVGCTTPLIWSLKTWLHKSLIYVKMQPPPSKVIIMKKMPLLCRLGVHSWSVYTQVNVVRAGIFEKVCLCCGEKKVKFGEPL